MAGFVKRSSAQRWNRTAGIVEAAGAGSHFVRGIYRQPMRPGSVCEELGDLQPGSYPAVAGATIAAGASGSVVYDGGIYQAINQSACPVRIGDLVGLHVSPNCEAFFVPCVCDCSSSAPADCCDRFVAVCINGYTQIVNLAECDASSLDPWATGPYYRFSVGACCVDYATDICTVESTPGNPDFYQVVLKLCCNASDIFLYYGTICTSGVPADPTIVDVSELCGSSPGVVTRDIIRTSESTEEVCAFTISMSLAATSELCEPCETPPAPSDCCDQSLYFCLNGVSQLLDVDGGNFTWDVSECCDATASLEVTLSCTGGVISMSWQYTAGEVFDAGAVNISAFCTDGAPRIFDFPGITCFLQMLISQVQFECSECTGGATTTELPPP